MRCAAPLIDGIEPTRKSHMQSGTRKLEGRAHLPGRQRRGPSEEDAEGGSDGRGCATRAAAAAAVKEATNIII